MTGTIGAISAGLLANARQTISRVGWRSEILVSWIHLFTMKEDVGAAGRKILGPARP